MLLPGDDKQNLLAKPITITSKKHAHLCERLLDYLILKISLYRKQNITMSDVGYMLQLITSFPNGP